MSAKKGTADIKTLSLALKQHHPEAISRAAKKAKLSGDGPTALSP